MRERIVQTSRADFIFAVGAPAFTYRQGTGPRRRRRSSSSPRIDTAAWTPISVSRRQLKLGLAELLARAAPKPRAPPAMRAPRPRAEPPAAGQRMSVGYVLQTLADVRDATSIVVEEAPTARHPMHEYLPILRSETYYTMDSGGLGYALPAAVGVALAHASRR